MLWPCHGFICMSTDVVCKEFRSIICFAIFKANHKYEIKLISGRIAPAAYFASG